ncbi:MAG: hypothetical protein QW303_08225, partial [Nitrososphaerota archaeon]
ILSNGGFESSNVGILSLYSTDWYTTTSEVPPKVIHDSFNARNGSKCLRFNNGGLSDASHILITDLNTDYRLNYHV